jgi:hypothetical protein
MTANPNPVSNIWRVLLLAFVLRVLLPISGYFYTHDESIIYGGDAAQYIVPARQLITHRRFFSDGSPAARVWNDPVAPEPDIIRTPGYPLLLTVGLLLGHLVPTTVALQILLSCLTVYMVYRLGNLIFEDEKVAVTAALLYAIAPLAVLFSSLLSTEALFTAVSTAGVYYLVKYLKRQSLKDLLFSASILAASVYVRPVGYFLPLMIVAVLILWMPFSHGQKIRVVLTHLGLFMVVFFGITSLWRARNKMVSGYSGFSSVFSDDMYCNTAASVLAASWHVSYVAVQNRLGCYDLGIYFRDHPQQRKEAVGTIIKYERDHAMLIFLHNPIIFARTYLAGVIRTVFDPGSTEFVRFFDFYPKEGGLLETAVDGGTIKALAALFANRPLACVTILLLIMHLLYISSACLSLFKLRQLDQAIVILVIIMSYYLVLPGGPSAWGRYRHPAMPFMCELAGYGLCGAWRERKAPHSVECHSYNQRRNSSPSLKKEASGSLVSELGSR